MTVKQLLNSIDSQELSEWFILEDLDFWKKRLAEKEAEKPPTTEHVLNALFSRSVAAGEVVWREPPQK